MQEGPPPGVAAGAAGDRPEALTGEAVEAVLADFRAWLEEAAGRGQAAPPPPDEAPAIDLHALLAQFTALRHEVHLQTRAVRGQQEQNGEALRQLGEALAALQQGELRARLGQEQARDEALRPLLKALVESHDALALAGREVRRVQEAVLPLLERAAAPPPEPEPEDPQPVVPAVTSPATPSFWARLFGLDSTLSQQQETIATLNKALADDRGKAQEGAPGQGRQREAAERARQMLASVVAGYTMSLQRVERALREHGLEAIPAAGEPFDPECMEVLEAVPDSGRPPGEVLDEVRRGYLWRGRVFRAAQVRVSRS
jgi:molecular chaperone GrpE